MPRKTRKTQRRRGSPALEQLTPASLKENAILSHLHGPQTTWVCEAGELVKLPIRHLVYGAEGRIRDVYFPIDCVLSIVTQMENGEAIEIGTIGREGMSGVPMLMGATTSANECYCQVPGLAIKVPGDTFHRLMTDPQFRALLDRYLQAYVNFLGQLTACNRLHTVYERCARWLLLTHDRVVKDDIELTHEYLAMMLGSRRSGVSIALAALRRAGYIRYAQGSITILDRPGLEETTCECYEVARKQFSGFLRLPNHSKR